LTNGFDNDQPTKRSLSTNARARVCVITYHSIDTISRYTLTIKTDRFERHVVGAPLLIGDGNVGVVERRAETSEGRSLLGNALLVVALRPRQMKANVAQTKAFRRFDVESNVRELRRIDRNEILFPFLHKRIKRQMKSTQQKKKKKKKKKTLFSYLGASSPPTIFGEVTFQRVCAALFHFAARSTIFIPIAPKSHKLLDSSSV
jgi:hypothetical protein